MGLVAKKHARANDVGEVEARVADHLFDDLEATPGLLKGIARRRRHAIARERRRCRPSSPGWTLTRSAHA